MNKEIEIAISLQSADQMLLPKGSVFRGRRFLNHDAEELLIGEAKGSGTGPICILIELPGGEEAMVQDLEKAIHQHFSYRRDKAINKLTDTVKLGFSSLFVAIVFLGILVSLVMLGSRFLPEGGLSLTIRELLIILGWVALWRPADLLLYDWRPFKREARLFQRFVDSRIKLVPEKQNG